MATDINIKMFNSNSNSNCNNNDNRNSESNSREEGSKANLEGRGGLEALLNTILP